MNLTKKQYDAILRAGTMCANVCYNLAQDHSISNDRQKAMIESYKAWDIAIMRQNDSHYNFFVRCSGNHLGNQQSVNNL